MSSSKKKKKKKLNTCLFIFPKKNNEKKSQNVISKVIKTYLPTTPEKFKQFKPRSQEVADAKTKKQSSEKSKNK